MNEWMNEWMTWTKEVDLFREQLWSHFDKAEISSWKHTISKQHVLQDEIINSEKNLDDFHFPFKLYGLGSVERDWVLLEMTVY